MRDDEVRQMVRTELLIAAADAARSVLAEDGVREKLSCYLMGNKLIDLLAAADWFED